MKLNSAMRTN